MAGIAHAPRLNKSHEHNRSLATGQRYRPDHVIRGLTTEIINLFSKPKQRGIITYQPPLEGNKSFRCLTDNPPFRDLHPHRDLISYINPACSHPYTYVQALTPPLLSTHPYNQLWGICLLFPLSSLFCIDWHLVWIGRIMVSPYSYKFDFVLYSFVFLNFIFYLGLYFYILFLFFLLWCPLVFFNFIFYIVPPLLKGRPDILIQKTKESARPPL